MQMETCFVAGRNHKVAVEFLVLWLYEIWELWLHQFSSPLAGPKMRPGSFVCFWKDPSNTACYRSHSQYQESVSITEIVLSSVQSHSHIWLCNPMDCSTPDSPSVTNSLSLLKLMSIELVMPSNNLILSCPLLLLPSIFPSIRVFCNESTLRIRWPKYWSFSFSISPSYAYLGLISFRIDLFELLVVQGILKSFLQCHSPKTSNLQCSVFFMVQLSHPYMTTRKTKALARWTFVNEVMSLDFNMLSKLVRTFFPRSKHLLISWLQSPSAVIVEPKRNKVLDV